VSHGPEDGERCGCGKALLWGAGNAWILHYVAHPAHKFVIIQCANCGSMVPLELLWRLDEAELLGCDTFPVLGPLPPMVADMAQKARLTQMTIDGFTLGERELAGVDLATPDAA
jgi:hypothetical protein